MPVTCKLVDKKYRVVEPSGKIAKNKSGTAVDGGGHTIKEACMKQARAINSAQDTAPLNACTFSQGCEVSCMQHTEAKDDNAFRIIAYSGQVIPDHWFWGNVAFDLEGIEFDKKKTPVLDFHSIGNRMGFTTKQEITNKVSVEGQFLSNSKAQELKRDMLEGFPMQASVYIPPNKIEFVKEGDTVEVNGHKLKGPGAIFRKAKIKDVIICTFGYDTNTRAQAFADNGKQEVQFSILEKEQIMPEEEKKIESAEMFAADYPDLHKEIMTAAKAEGMAEGKTEGGKAEKERFDKIKELAPNDPAFIVEQFAEGKSVEEAKTNLIEKLQTGTGQHIDPARQEFSDQQAEPEKKEDQDGKPATFDAAVEARVKADSRDVSDTKKKADAVRFCVGKYPDLHAKFIEANRQKN